MLHQPFQKCQRLLATITAAILCLSPKVALAHDAPPLHQGEIWRAWSWDPLLGIGLVLTIGLYGRGIRRLWRRTQVDRGVKVWQATAFMGGCVALVGAFFSPVEVLSGELLSAHMIQHMLLIVTAAPLLMLGAPTIAFAWAFPVAWNRKFSRGWHRRPLLQRGWQLLVQPSIVWLTYIITLTFWHLPFFYEAALQNELIHRLEHATFLGTALLFWNTVLNAGRISQFGFPGGLFLVFTAALYHMMMAALMVFSNVPWYPTYAIRTVAWGITLIQDQQLAGIIMWVPGKIIHVVTIVGLLWTWFKQMERRKGDDALREANVLPRDYIPAEALFRMDKGEPLGRPLSE